MQGRLPEGQCLSVDFPSSQACYAAAVGSWVVPILLSSWENRGPGPPMEVKDFCCPHSLDKMLNLGKWNGALTVTIH